LASWSLLFNALRATRDYHFIIVDPPTEPWRWAQRLESIAAVGAFEAAVAICIDRLQAEGVVLMASAESASAAVVLAAQRRDVLAVALVDAKLIGPMSRWEPVLDAIKDRQSWWLFGQQGSEVLSEIRSRLALARVVVKPGGSAGIDLLNQAKRASSGLAGWLFAITPSVIEPLRQNDG
ncbi:MAG TPA: hypothetical protein DCQ06_12960, partial [Myxococcales bacterium]|nr:hypothetical protein [Myxococcales bacterium]